MTTTPDIAARSALQAWADTDATGSTVPALVEEAPCPKTAVPLLLGGLVMTGLLSGTVTTAPIAESPVRYIGGWTSTARVVAAGAVGSGIEQLASRRPGSGVGAVPVSAADAGASAQTVEQAADVAGTAGTEWATPADEVRWLHEASGLTWEQLGRVFGVSRRAVHLWANGGRMNAANAELLAQLVVLVRELPANSADERRVALLAPSPEGSSVVDRLRARNRSDSRDVSGTPFRPEELVGARHDDTGMGTRPT